MPYCKGCGKKEWPIFLTESGYCQDCSDARYSNQGLYDCKKTFVERRAPANLQRIYDAFRKEYPDALVTGVLQHSDDCIIIYLDGKPAYYATFDPLTAKAKLRSYGTPSTSTDHRGYYAASGVASFVGILFGVLLLKAFSFPAGAVGIIASLVSLSGSIARSRVAVILGAVFMLFPLVFTLLSAPYVIIMLICIACSY